MNLHTRCVYIHEVPYNSQRLRGATQTCFMDDEKNLLDCENAHLLMKWEEFFLLITLLFFFQNHSTQRLRHIG